MLSLIALRAFAQPSHSLLCRNFAVLCSTDTSFGECGYDYSGQDCHTCYGDDGSTLPNAPECS
jgi:hypothetical protein